MNKTTTEVKKKKDPLPCTIDPGLFEAWKKLKRFRDSEYIGEEFGWSRPTVDNALNYGHVKSTELVGHINTYFSRRLKSEKATGEALMELQASTEAPAKEATQSPFKRKKNEKLAP